MRGASLVGEPRRFSDERRVSLATLWVLMAAAVGLIPSPAGACGNASDVDPKVQLLLDHLNDDRARQGADHLEMNSPVTGTRAQRLRSAGVDLSGMGENISASRTVLGAYQALLSSRGHRANILSASSRRWGWPRSPPLTGGAWCKSSCGWIRRKARSPRPADQ